MNPTVLNVTIGQKQMYGGCRLLLEGSNCKLMMALPKAANAVSKNLIHWSNQQPCHRHEHLIIEGNAPGWVYLVVFTTLSQEFKRIELAWQRELICLQSPDDLAPAAESRDVPALVDNLLSALGTSPSLAEDAFPEPMPAEHVARQVPPVPAPAAAIPAPEPTGLESPVAWDGAPDNSNVEATA